MQNKNAVLITGGADRIGREIALNLADKGFNIALHYNSAKAKAEKTRNEILSKNVFCEIYKWDFNKPKLIPDLFERISQDFELSVLINSASIFYENDFLESTSDEFDKFFNINFKTPYILTKEFAKKTPENSLIINLLDTKIVKNETPHFNYLLTKKFLEDFTKLSAYHLAPKIRVNAIAPGLILPPPGRDDEYLNRRAQNIPLKKKGDLKNITQAVNFLIENDFVTGQIIFVDGGENL